MGSVVSLALFGQRGGIRQLALQLNAAGFFLSAQFPVILFFVLSGFVLARQIDQGRSSYPQFVIRRICRIWIPYAASILLAWGLADSIGTPIAPGVAHAINTDWAGAQSFDALLRHLVMKGRHEDTNLNGVAWSLIVEMRVSLLFPLLMLAFVRRSWAIWVFGIARLGAYFLAVKLGQPTPFYFGTTIALSFLVTAYFLLPFGVGIAVSRYCSAAQPMVAPAAWLSLLVIAVGVFIAMKLPAAFAKDVVYSVLAGLLIVVALRYASLSTLLERPPFQWLERISYSLYLTHVIVINALIKGCYQQAPLILLIVVATPTSFFMAEIANRLVEQPAARLGRALSSRLAITAKSQAVGSASPPSAA